MELLLRKLENIGFWCKMGFIDWLFGGKNFEIKRTGEVADIIYPAYNGTNGWFTKPRWDLVLRVDKFGNIIKRKYLWNYSTVEALEAIIKLGEEDEKNSNSNDGKYTK